MDQPVSPEDWARVERLFDEVMTLPPEERAAYLEDRAGADEWLRSEVRSLVAFAHTEAGAPLERIVADAARRAGVLSGGAVGTRLGPYRLESEIGRGGMGVVYLGVREGDDFEQRVAVKLLPGALYSDELTWRFRTERRILASLEHPGVARFLDGGATSEGVPYAVMEYVDGVPIDAYCRERGLDLDECLDLFAKVCEAVRYAHAQLVVHRDIKPANILVDGSGMPRLLDFGIAKLVEPGEDAGDRTATRLMTPEFASPEQVAGQVATTATDVYSLGALLYVLLTGRRAHEDADSRSDLARRIVEVDPRPPSRVSEDRRLVGDLDTIVLKAMRRDPAERYASVDRLIQDVAAYRASLPISAAPLTLAYRARKFAHRNRAAVIAASVAILAVVVGSAAATVGMLRARAAEADAQEEARVAAEVSDFLVGLFGESDPEVSLGGDPTARELLDAGVERIDRELAGQPAIQTRLKQVMARSYVNLGALDEAQRLYAQALQVAPTDELRAALHSSRGGTLRQLNRLDEALASVERAVAVAAPHVDTTDAESMSRTPELSAALVGGLQERGVVLVLMGDSAEAISSLERANRLRERLDGPEGEDTATSMTALAAGYANFGRPEEAEALYRRAIGLYEVTYELRHPYLLLAYDGLATTLARLERFDSASAIFQRLLPLQREVWGTVHPRTAQTLHNLGTMSIDAGDDEAGERYLREALEIEGQLVGADSLLLTAGLNNLALIRQRAGDFEEAERLWQRATAIRRAALGDDNPRTISTLLGVANMRRLQEDWQGSAEAYGEAIAGLRTSGPVAPVILRDYAQVLRALGREEEAEAVERGVDGR